MKHPVPIRRTPVTAWAGIGANLGDAPHTLREARSCLSAHPQIHHVVSAPLYRTSPVGYAKQPDFFNSVMSFSTTLPAHALLKVLLSIEDRFGRRRSFKNAPRTLDLDLLAYGNAIIHSDKLIVPHPEMKNRLFVLRPLLDIAPEWTFPNGTPAMHFYTQCTNAEQKKENAPPAYVRISDSSWMPAL